MSEALDAKKQGLKQLKRFDKVEGKLMELAGGFYVKLTLSCATS